jgi:hypothetical protein
LLTKLTEKIELNGKRMNVDEFMASIAVPLQKRVPKPLNPRNTTVKRSRSENAKSCTTQANTQNRSPNTLQHTPKVQKSAQTLQNFEPIPKINHPQTVQIGCIHKANGAQRKNGREIVEKTRKCKKIFKGKFLER